MRIQAIVLFLNYNAGQYNVQISRNYFELNYRYQKRNASNNFLIVTVPFVIITDIRCIIIGFF